MKKFPIEILQAQLAEFSKLVNEIESLASRQGAAESELARLTESGDLCDDTVLDRIGRLQLFTQLFPARIAIREKTISEAKGLFVEAMETLTGNDMRIRFAHLNKLAHAYVETQLKTSFKDAYQLRNAVNNSDTMAEANGFWANLNGCSAAGLERREHAATVSCATRIIALWKRGEELEARLK